jgi:hypothetical protein
MLPCPCHLCAFFGNSDQEYRVLAPFVKDGLRAGEKVFQILEDGHCEERRRRLQEMGIDIAAAERSGQIEVRAWGQAYRRDGRFNQEGMLTLLEEAMASGKRQGFVRTRLWADLDWEIDIPKFREIAEYEVQLDRLVSEHDGVLVVGHDTIRFGAAVVVYVLETHRFTIVSSILQENPFRVSPAEYLEILRRRATLADVTDQMVAPAGTEAM